MGTIEESWQTKMEILIFESGHIELHGTAAWYFLFNRLQWQIKPVTKGVFHRNSANAVCPRLEFSTKVTIHHIYMAIATTQQEFFEIGLLLSVMKISTRWQG